MDSISIAPDYRSELKDHRYQPEPTVVTSPLLHLTYDKTWINALVGQLREQISTFEKSYGRTYFASATDMRQHFESVVNQIDIVYENTKHQLKHQISAIQVDGIKQMNLTRALGQQIESYLNALDTRAELQVGNLAYQIMNSSQMPEDSRLKESPLAGHPQLIYLLNQHTLSSKEAEKIAVRFQEIQETIASIRTLRHTARTMIAQACGRSGLADIASTMSESARQIDPALTVARLTACGKTSRREDRVFMQMYEALCHFKEQNGHCDVPRRYKADKRLAIWTANLRARRKTNLVPSDRVTLLDAIGFSWHSTRSRWATRLSELSHFIKINGHSIVPLHYPENPCLSAWVRNLRKEYKRNCIAPEKVKQLKQIGFTFEVLELRWQSRYEELQIFKARFGHCNVPNNYPQNPSLARWVSIQRDKKKRNSLENNRVQLLDLLGFEWSPRTGRPRKAADKSIAPSSTAVPVLAPTKIAQDIATVPDLTTVQTSQLIYSR